MRIGPVTIRWTKHVDVEAKECAATDRVQHQRIILLAAELYHAKQTLHRWGLDEGLDMPKAATRMAREPSKAVNP